MNLKVYAIYDKKSEMFLTPTFVEADAIAIRSFCTLCGDRETAIGLYPEDFALFYLGEYISRDGSIASCSPKILIDGLTASGIWKQKIDSTEVAKNENI